MFIGLPGLFGFGFPGLTPGFPSISFPGLLKLGNSGLPSIGFPGLSSLGNPGLAGVISTTVLPDPSVVTSSLGRWVGGTSLLGVGVGVGFSAAGFDGLGGLHGPMHGGLWWNGG